MTTPAYADRYADRYVAAVARAVPAAARADVVAELEAAIADQVEPRIEAGESAPEAERAVVAALGEPLAYAASLTDRPLHLIGPRYFAAWWRLLKLLLAIVPACAVFGVVLANAVQGADIGRIFGAAIPVLVQVMVNIGFWTTLVFAVLERTASTGDTVLQWTPDQLPKRTAVSPATRSDLIGTIAVFAILVGSVIWDRVIGWGDQHVHVLSPDLWPWVMTAWFALLALDLVVEIVVAVRGRWTPRLALANILLALVTLIGAITLVWRNAVLDPQLVARMHAASNSTTDVVQIVNIVLTVVMAGILISILFDAYRKLGFAREGVAGSPRRHAE